MLVEHSENDNFRKTYSFFMHTHSHALSCKNKFISNLFVYLKLSHFNPVFLNQLSLQ